MTDEVLKKPVHAILVKPTHLDKLVADGRIPESAVPAVNKSLLPQKQQAPKRKLNVLRQLPSKKFAVNAGTIRKQQRARMKVTMQHQAAEVPGGDKTPPCSSCVTAACCHAFIVEITKEEYDSGLYVDQAVKLEPEAFAQLKSKFLRLTAVNGPHAVTTAAHVLDGLVGQPCPFLQEDSSCGIYEHRPITCRVYTCVGDSRITEGMRTGTDPILSVIERAIHDTGK